MQDSTNTRRVYPTAPDHCTHCGNIEYYADKDGWWCSWCRPPMLRDVEYGAKGSTPQSIGIPKPWHRTKGFYSPSEVLEYWPDNWEPPCPVGPALGAITLRARRTGNKK